MLHGPDTIICIAPGRDGYVPTWTRCHTREALATKVHTEIAHRNLQICGGTHHNHIPFNCPHLLVYWLPRFWTRWIFSSPWCTWFALTFRAYVLRADVHKCKSNYICTLFIVYSSPSYRVCSVTRTILAAPTPLRLRPARASPPRFLATLSYSNQY